MVETLKFGRMDYALKMKTPSGDEVLIILYGSLHSSGRSGDYRKSESISVWL